MGYGVTASCGMSAQAADLLRWRQRSSHPPAWCTRWSATWNAWNCSDRMSAQLGPCNVLIVEGEAPEALDDLPAPDCAFVGGAEAGLQTSLNLVASRMRAHGRIVVNLAAMERVALTQACLESLGFEVEITMISASRGKPLPDGTMRLAARKSGFHSHRLGWGWAE